MSLRLRSNVSAARASRPNGACRLIVRAQQQQPSRPAVQQQVASQVLAAGLALGISLTAVPVVAPQPAVAASQYSSLADIVRKDFAFVDEDKNGIITKDELLRTSKTVAEDIDFMIPSDEQLDFTMKLFDLNQDGTLSTDELLASIALDGAVGDDAVDADVVSVFDKDGDGYVTLREFKSGVPPLGPNGEAAKEYIFGRVDSVVDGDGKLDPQEFANALVILRTAVLGY